MGSLNDPDEMMVSPGIRGPVPMPVMTWAALLGARQSPPQDHVLITVHDLFVPHL